MTCRTENWVIGVSTPGTPNIEKGELIHVKAVPRTHTSKLKERIGLGNILDLNSGHVCLCNSKLPEKEQLVLLIKEQIIQ